MNEIKFKALIKEGNVLNKNKIVDVLGIDFEKEEIVFETKSSEASIKLGASKTVRWCTKFKNIVLLQYTGLKDKNGVEIYEGDIVYLNWSPDSINHFSVVWSENYGRFRFKLGGCGPCLDIQKECEACIEIVNWSANYHKECEVVGNIFENSELLESE